MARDLPIIDFSDLHAQWLSHKWDSYALRYPNEQDRWRSILLLNKDMTIECLGEVLRHSPPLQCVAEYFCVCKDADQKEHLRALLILEKYGVDLINELNNPERKRDYAAKSGLAKNDPMLSWDVWSSHRSVWKKYMEYGGVVLEKDQPASHLKIMLLDNLPTLIDVLPKADLSLEQSQELLNMVCVDLSTRENQANKTSVQLKRCAQVLLKKLPPSVRRQTLNTPPYKDGCWDDVVKKTKFVKEKSPSNKNQVVPTISIEDAKKMREKRLTRAKAEQILASGLNVEYTNTLDYTLLQQVVSERLVSALPMVLSHNPTINVRSNEKSTVCTWAADDHRILKMLLDAGANPWLENDYHHNALHLAILNTNVKNVELLVQHPGFNPKNKSYALLLAQARTSVPKFEVKIITIFNILISVGTDMSWRSEEYPSFVDYFAKRCQYHFPHLIPVFKHAMENLQVHQQAIAIEKHIALPAETSKPRKM